jgi:hypothetical protein
MRWKSQWRRFIDHPIVEWAVFAVGLVLLIVSPLVGLIPGPGGIVIAGIGLMLILKTSMWAKRRYVRAKKLRLKAWGWETTLGDLTDRALRRRSAKRREALRKAPESGSGN